MTQEDIRNRVRAWAVERPLVLEVVLFGSRARGDHSEASDVDLAVRCAAQRNRKPLGSFIENAATWKTELAEILGLPVDLEPLDAELTLIGANLRKDAVALFRR